MDDDRDSDFSDSDFSDAEKMVIDTNTPTTWIGVCTPRETDLNDLNDLNDTKSCLSPDVISAVKNSNNKKLDLMLHGAISYYLKQNPLFCITHTQVLDDAIEILYKWYSSSATSHGDPPKLPSDRGLSIKWREYFGKQHKIKGTVVHTNNDSHYVRTSPPSPKFNLSFEVSAVDGYKVIGQRDLMIALFGWHATMYNNIFAGKAKTKHGFDHVTNLPYEMSMEREDFLQFYHIVDTC